MKKTVKEQNVALNQLYKKQDELFHNYATHYGFSDGAFWVLYSLCETDEVYTQNVLAEMWCFPKQTVNSAISSLVKAGYVHLEQIAAARNSKAVKLTKKGLDVCQSIIMPLMEAEQRALSRLSETERDVFIDILGKQYDLLQTEIESIIKVPKMKPDQQNTREER